MSDQQPPQRRATTTRDGFWTLDPNRAVFPGDPWYANLERHFADWEYQPVEPLVLRLEPIDGVSRHAVVGLVGHRGAGKSTVVRKAMERMAKEHNSHAVYVDVVAALDRTDLTFADALMAMVNAVAAELAAASAKVPETELALFRLYFAEELLTEEHVKELSGSIETSAEAGGGVPFFAKLLGKVTALVKSDSEYRREIRRKIERSPQDMIRRANQFLNAAAAALGRALIVVFDNLEKVSDRSLVEAAFLARADDLRSLRTSIVLFLHPADEFAPHRIRASDACDVVSLPMLPVRLQEQGYTVVNPHVHAAVRELLELRLDLAELTDEPAACVRRVCLHSGGRLRDVLEIMRAACERAGARKITVDLIDRCARKLAGERAAMLRPGDHERLVEVSNSKQVPNDEAHAYLLLHSMVLQYNGVPWWDIHPLLLLVDRFRAKLPTVTAS
ncbi:MAG: AAA family ATPase [Myxococcales bacterium]|nr:AAA family ATPase [Myxococcales bacterium]